MDAFSSLTKAGPAESCVFLTSKLLPEQLAVFTAPPGSVNVASSVGKGNMFGSRLSTKPTSVRFNAPLPMFWSVMITRLG